LSLSPRFTLAERRFLEVNPTCKGFADGRPLPEDAVIETRESGQSFMVSGTGYVEYHHHDLLHDHLPFRDGASVPSVVLNERGAAVLRSPTASTSGSAGLLGYSGGSQTSAIGSHGGSHGNLSVAERRNPNRVVDQLLFADVIRTALRIILFKTQKDRARRRGIMKDILQAEHLVGFGSENLGTLIVILVEFRNTVTLIGIL
jgi:hypothetical protein